MQLTLAKLEGRSRDDGRVDRVLVREMNESSPLLLVDFGEVGRPQSFVVKVHDLWVSTISQCDLNKELDQGSSAPRPTTPKGSQLTALIVEYAPTQNRISVKSPFWMQVMLRMMVARSSSMVKVAPGRSQIESFAA